MQNKLRLDLIIMLQTFSILSNIFFVLFNYGKKYVKIAHYDFEFVFFLCILPTALQYILELGEQQHINFKVLLFPHFLFLQFPLSLLKNYIYFILFSTYSPKLCLFILVQLQQHSFDSFLHDITLFILLLSSFMCSYI